MTEKPTPVIIDKAWLRERIVKAFEKLDKNPEVGCFYIMDNTPDNITLDGFVNLDELVNLIVDGTNG